MLAEQHPAELLEPCWRILERPDDRLPLRDVEAEHLDLAAVAILQPVGERVVVDEAGELEDQVIADGDPARNTRSTLQPLSQASEPRARHTPIRQTPRP